MCLLLYYVLRKLHTIFAIFLISLIFFASREEVFNAKLIQQVSLNAAQSQMNVERDVSYRAVFVFRVCEASLHWHLVTRKRLRRTQQAAHLDSLSEFTVFFFFSSRLHLASLPSASFSYGMVLLHCKPCGWSGVFFTYYILLESHANVYSVTLAFQIHVWYALAAI